MKSLLLSIIFLFITTSTFATTWSEPWQDEIIKKSEYFIYGKIIAASDSVVMVEVQQSFGKPVSGKITIDTFFMLELCSTSGGHGPEFDFAEGQEGYFFLKRTDKGTYAIPTPSSGFDAFIDNKVHATYRHTYHQAAVDKATYELTYLSIWNYLHGKKIDKAPLMKFINGYLAKPAGGFDESEIEIFFNQHAALETAFLLNIELEFDVLKKFLECDNYHSQISSARAMGLLKTKKAKAYMLDYIRKKDANTFAQTMMVWGLWKIDSKALLAIKDGLPESETGFGGNIMDPRVCTYLPSPKEAVALLEHIDKN